VLSWEADKRPGRSLGWGLELWEALFGSCQGKPS
jgi:hypothetical protein